MGIINLFFLSLLVTNFFLQGTKAANCPKNWRRYNDQCIGIFNTPVHWAEAEAACLIRGEGGHLLSFSTDAELDFIVSFIKFSFPDVESVWIGLEDPYRTKQWKWTDSNPFNFQPWDDAEDIESKGSCAFLLGNKGFKKIGTGCCRKKRPYICKSVL